MKNFRVPDYEDDKFNFFKKENYITSKHAKPVNVIIISEPMRLTDKLPNIQSICLNNYLERTETDHIKISNKHNPDIIFLTNELKNYNKPVSVSTFGSEYGEISKRDCRHILAKNCPSPSYPLARERKEWLDEHEFFN